MSRWVRVSADIFEHEFFSRSEMSEREAWLWLITKAAWKDTRHRIGGEMHTCERGSLFTTLRTLADAWGWKSDKRVRLFLEALERENMIRRKMDAGKTQIFINNYDTYQSSGRTEDASGTQTGRKQDALKIPEYQDTIIEPTELTVPTVLVVRTKKQKKSDSREAMLAEFADLGPDLASEVVSHRTAKGSAPTVYACRLLMDEFKKTGDPPDAARMMIRNGWKGFEASWWQNEQRNKANRQRQSGAQRGSIVDLMSGLAGVPPQWSDGGLGRGRDDLRGSGTDRTATDDLGGAGRTIEGRAVRLSG